MRNDILHHREHLVYTYQSNSNSYNVILSIYRYSCIPMAVDKHLHIYALI